ncbi:MAG: hypothetical protein IKH86_04275 [Prevotella sp.]|nr:hypothetical protein [Prevotella sp.]
MKKFFFIASVALALIFTSCNNKKGFEGMSSSEDPAAEAVMAAVEEADTLQSLLLQEIEEQDIKGLTQAIGEAQMRITELADSGDVEVARVYAMKLHQVIKDNAEDIKAFAIDDATLNQIVVKIANMPLGANDDAATIVKALGTAAKEGAKQASEITIRRSQPVKPATVEPVQPAETTPAPQPAPAAKPAAPKAAPAAKPAAPAKAAPAQPAAKPAQPARQTRKDEGGEVRL